VTVHTKPLRVHNAGFLLSRLAADCAPLQEYRELTQNSIEAILRLVKSGRQAEGEILWDVDWIAAGQHRLYKLSIIDNGEGMTGQELVKYINHLSSSSTEQSLEGNFGVGAKITAGVRNPLGIVYMSWRDGKGSMIHFWLDPDTKEYGLKQFLLPDGTYALWAEVEDEAKPEIIRDHGTVVVLLGATRESNTVEPPSGAAYPTHWLTRYLNRRYFAFPEKIRVRVREFSRRDPSSWPTSPKVGMGDEGSQLRRVLGQSAHLDKHKVTSGTVPLTGATARWWLLKDDIREHDLWQTTGHVAALYQNELYEMRDGQAGRRVLQSFGVLFGSSRVVIYVEPEPSARKVTSNTARSSLVLDGEPLPWDKWAEEFRGAMPDAIQDMMDELVAGSGAKNHQEAIRQRLKAIRDLLRLTKYRRTPQGDFETDEDVPGGKPKADTVAKPQRGAAPSGGSGGRNADLYGSIIRVGGDPAEVVIPKNIEPEVAWVFLSDGTREAGDLEDKAARFVAPTKLLINGDFRVFTDMITHFCRLYEGVPGAPEVIAEVVREWFEQQLIETVLGIRTLEGSKQWSDDVVQQALSEEALTAAAMPRYNLYGQVRRSLGQQLGGLKNRDPGSAAASA